MEKLKSLSARAKRKLAITGGAVAIIAAVIAVSISRDAVAGFSLAVGSTALLVTLTQLIKPKPELTLRFFAEGRATECLVTPPARYPGLDLARIIENERTAAMSTLPVQPRPNRAGSALANYDRIIAASTGAHVSADQRQEFHARVEAHLREVGEYLELYEQRRHTSGLEINAEVKLDNAGEAQATNIRVRLLFSVADFEELDDDQERLPDAPEGPRWRHPFDRPYLGVARDLGRMLLPRTIRQQALTPRGGLAGPTYSREAERLIVEYSAGHVGAAVWDRSRYAFELQAMRSGDHDVEYQLSADGLEPTTGTLTITLREPEPQAPPITQLKDLPELD